MVYCSEGEALTPDATRLIVLLVEDDPEGRRLYAECLRRAGFHVAEAHNGLQEPCSPDVLERSLRSRATDRRRLGEARP